MLSPAAIKVAYLVSAVMFIFGLKYMTHPRTAVRGNRLGAIAMLLAFVVTLMDGRIHGFLLIFLGSAVGTAIGAAMAKKIAMTDMPQLVALFNGLGGAASVLVAGGELFDTGRQPTDVMVATALTGLIGAVTLTGSIVAFGKLQGLPIFKKEIDLDNQQFVNLALGALTIVLGLVLSFFWGEFGLYALVCIVAAVLGVMLVLPIGGADMPVVIALLNSYSGLAASATGFVMNNNVLIIAGSLVGASGLILCQIMCKAMNRSLVHVLFGKMESGGSVTDADEIYKSVRRSSADDVAMILDTAERVVIVPGYGMAVAQAQHAVRDLANLLEERDCQVEYAIHPVAGRMPGHMNVLLAEADVPYEQLIEMDHINPTLGTVDVAIVIGANDVVNPVARTDPDSPIAGMPIIDVDKARTVVVIKRSLSPGFAGIPNPLFGADNCLMLFDDGKKAVMDLVTAIKEG